MSECHCGQPAEYHIELGDGTRQFVCAADRFVVRDDDHLIGPGCGFPEAEWLADGCYVLTSTEVALAAVIDAAADRAGSEWIWRLDPESEYYGVTGIMIRDSGTLARFIAAMLPAGTAYPPVDEGKNDHGATP